MGVSKVKPNVDKKKTKAKPSSLKANAVNGALVSSGRRVDSKARSGAVMTSKKAALKSTHAVAKPARIELKTTDTSKKVLTKAARLTGVDLQAFVISTAEEHAREVIKHHESLTLSDNEQKRFLEILSNPPRATSKLKKLMALESLDER